MGSVLCDLVEVQVPGSYSSCPPEFWPDVITKSIPTLLVGVVSAGLLIPVLDEFFRGGGVAVLVGTLVSLLRRFAIEWHHLYQEGLDASHEQQPTNNNTFVHLTHALASRND